MKRLFKVAILGTILGIILYMYQSLELSFHSADYHQSRGMIERDQKSIEQTFLPTQTEMTLTNVLGRSDDWLVSTFGEPIRVDPSRYGYDWYLYTDESNVYLQFGVEDEQVVTLFMTGDHAQIGPIEMGMSYQELNEAYPFESEINFDRFKFILDDQDLVERPIVQLEEGSVVQFNFDTVTETLSSIRVMNQEVAVKHQPYTLYYSGILPKKAPISEQKWELITQAEEYHIFLLTNLVRARFDKQPLEWDEQAQQVARQHSQDMHDQNYFSHTSLDGRVLSDRLTEHDILFSRAGENLAAQYTDGLAAVEGWLNSDGHREVLLDDQFTNIGIGVYQNYFTQNFLTHR
ncbi:CAP domain-containing protein [Amphibacillus sediminis]|uniref:CAP domain-containing protein n=1 Tax=Amphibacillus sediminis TaxID=360185 RepID=UPI00082CCF5B|nr:CAP-associated domain-containing protein [Amphibacillus sediminis]